MHHVRLLLGSAMVAMVTMTACSGGGGAVTAPTSPSAGVAEAAHGAQAVRITEKSFAIVPDRITAHAGRVTFEIHNRSRMEHEFVVLRTGKGASHLPMENAARAHEIGHVGEDPGIKPGAIETLTLRLRPGHYVVLCNLPGHYGLGMHADLVVT